MTRHTVRRVPFSEEHSIYREQVRRFVAQEIVPNHDRWEREGQVTRALWQKAGANGFLCPSMEERHGGPGGDFLHSVIMIEELAREGLTGPGFFVHSEMVAPYLVAFGTGEQQRRWLPAMATGEVIGAIAMTEPGAGSDLRGMRTTARRADGGWRITGQKTFISNGQLANLVVVAARADDGAGRNDITLFLVDAASKGFTRGRKLEKVGILAQDTSELFFEEVFVPDHCVLGHPGDGFRQLMHGLARERLAIAISCQAKAESVIEWTTQYARDRNLFGQQLSQFQNTRFRMAEMSTEAVVGRSFVDDAINRYLEGSLDATHAAVAKLWVSEMLGRVADGCLQLHGGWGYMREYRISRAWVDSRVERIVGGSSEVMKEIIGRSLWATGD